MLVRDRATQILDRDTYLPGPQAQLDASQTHGELGNELGNSGTREGRLDSASITDRQGSGAPGGVVARAGIWMQLLSVHKKCRRGRITIINGGWLGGGGDDIEKAKETRYVMHRRAREPAAPELGEPCNSMTSRVVIAR